MANPVEAWKSEKHGFDVWPDVLRYAQARTPMHDIETPDLERMKWHGAFYRKRDGAGTYMLRIRLTGCELAAEQARVEHRQQPRLVTETLDKDVDPIEIDP
jgi:sulfite reductase beta subunit-like hemoprotein